MTYNEYLFSCLLKIYDKEFEQMEYDLQYERIAQRYLGFTQSKFNVDTKGEYECIIDYLKDKMSNTKRLVTVEVTRYYSKTSTVQIEVSNSLIDDELVDYLTNDEEVDSLFEDAIADASLVGDETTYEWQDPTNETGGTL